MENENGKETKGKETKSKPKAQAKEQAKEVLISKPPVPAYFQCPICDNKHGLSGHGVNEMCPNCSNLIVAVPVFMSI